jgi:hypothetical protein
VSWVGTIVRKISHFALDFQIRRGATSRNSAEQQFDTSKRAARLCEFGGSALWPAQLHEIKDEI